MPLLSTTIGFLEPIAIALVNGICHMYRSGTKSMSSRASAARCDAHTSGSWSGPSRTAPASSCCWIDRSPNSISLRTTVSIIGICCSAAVAARSAGCSYDFGEMSG